MFNQEKHIAQTSQSNFTFTKKGISTSSQAVSSATSQVILLPCFIILPHPRVPIVPNNGDRSAFAAGKKCRFNVLSRTFTYLNIITPYIPFFECRHTVCVDTEYCIIIVHRLHFQLPISFENNIFIFLKVRDPTPPIQTKISRFCSSPAL